MRAVAAASVLLVHSLGPYRDKLGEIPDVDWTSAVALNGALRWGVPVFIMITGALMLSDRRPFSFSYYLKRRLLKVLVPFLAFSTGYAVLAGISPAGFDVARTTELLTNMHHRETWYHLGFFYYFLPLYILIPILRPLMDYRWIAVAALCGWIFLTSLRLAGVSGPWNVDLVMFGGYLLLGHVLWQRRASSLVFVAVLALGAVCLSDWTVITNSLQSGRYRTGLWFSYTTVNTVVVASFVFLACRWLTERLGERTRQGLELVGRHSLGIYLLHPLFLWPARAYDLYAGYPLIPIFFWALVAGSLALLASVLLSKSPYTRWLVP